MIALATVRDLQDRWPSFPTGQEDFANTMLTDASNMIRDRWPDVDDRINAGTLLAESVARVVCAMVKAAMLNPESEGIESFALTAGPFGDTRKFANPNGSLYFTAEMIRLLDGYNRPTARMGWLC